MLHLFYCLYLCYHHSKADALGREREQALALATNSYRRCRQDCLNNFVSTSAIPAHNMGQSTGMVCRKGQTGWEECSLSILSCTHPFMLRGQGIYNSSLERAKVPIRQKLPCTESFRLKWVCQELKVPMCIWEGKKDFRIPASSKGHLIQKVLGGFTAQS